MKHFNPLMELVMRTTTDKFIPTCFHNLSRFAIMFVMYASATAAYSATDQIHFSSPDEAIEVLITAVKEDDVTKLIEVLGQDAKPVLESGDPVEDKAGRERFLEAYQEAKSLDKSNDMKVMLEIGKDNWQFPIPLVKEENGWRFDTAAGREEILNRRIGRNELFAIQSILAYVDAQMEYYLANPQNEKVFSYANKILSTPDTRDGLYYTVNADEQLSPLGELYAKAQAKGYSSKSEVDSQPQAYHGYYYRILTSQGAQAPGGAYDYLADGKMVGGHALIAWPATYGNSGVMTFIVNHDGVVHEKDLGPNTGAIAKEITLYNPDQAWNIVTEEHLNTDG